MRFRRFVVCIGLVGMMSVNVAQAALLSRLGGLAVYDSDTNLTWLADANAARGSSFDDGFSSSDGLMTFASALAWARNLNVAGVTGWRLPTTVQPDPSCRNQTGGGRISFGTDCTGSEMGHLFYVELSGEGFPFNPPLDGILAYGDPDLALFNHIQSRPGAGGIYHSATRFNAANHWLFNFNNGIQAFNNNAHGHYAWAVHDGDVGLSSSNPEPVPAPAAGLPMALGLAWLAKIRHRRTGRGR